MGGCRGSRVHATKRDMDRRQADVYFYEPGLFGAGLLTRFTEAQLKQTTVGRQLVNLASGARQNKFTIGIDPGKSTGFAVWNRQAQQFDILKTITPSQALKQCSAYSVDDTRIVIEVPGTKANFHVSSSHTQSVNIGMVIGQARLMADYLKAEGFTVIEKHPQGKVSADEFKRLTGHQGRTNEHSRDSGMLAFGG